MHVALAILRDMFTAAASGRGHGSGSAAQYASAAVAAAAKAGGGGGGAGALPGSPLPPVQAHGRVSVTDSIGGGGRSSLSQAPPEGAEDAARRSSMSSAPPYGAIGPDGQPRPVVSDEGARAIELHRWKSSAAVGGGVGARLYGEYSQCRATLKEKKGAYAALTTSVNECKRDIDALLRHLTAAAAERTAAGAAGGPDAETAAAAAAARESTLVGRLKTAKAEHKRRMDTWTDAKAEIEFLQVRR